MTSFRQSARSYPPGAVVLATPTADGWPLRTFDWPGTGNRGNILWLGGRGDFFEKYLECFVAWHADGWGVTSLDWRGQGGSGRLLPDRQTGHIRDFGTWVDDLAVFWAAWTRERTGPCVLMGHSMGGHLVLRALVERRVDPAAVVLSAPMLGLEVAPVLSPVAPQVAAMLGRLLALRRAWPSNEKPGVADASRAALLTCDAGRYEDEIWWSGTKPDLLMGPPSWAWVAAAYRSIALLDRASAVETVTTPMLIIGTDGDQLVSPAAIRTYAGRIAGSELLMFDPSVAHEVLREVDAVRDAAMARIADFLDRKAPAC